MNKSNEQKQCARDGIISPIDRDKKLIMQLLDAAISKNELDSFMLLLPDYSIRGRDLNGYIAPRAHYSWEALYEYANINPDFPMVDEIKTVLCRNAVYKGERAIENTLGFIEYHLSKEKVHQAPFHIDFQEVISQLRKTIQQNRELYLVPKEAFQNEPYWTRIEQHSERLREEFAVELLETGD